MATTSQMYTSGSSVPTSTLASASSTPPNDPSDVNPSPSSKSGSLPLVMAFLGASLLTIIIIGVYGWRRFVRSRALHEQPVVPIRRRQLILSEKRPTLWDLEAGPKVLDKSFVTSATRWENITPITAILMFRIPSVQPLHVDPGLSPPIRSVNLNGRILCRTLRSMLSTVKRSYLPDPPPPSPPPPSNKKQVASPVSHAPDETQWGDAASLQVSVIIVMPTQRRCYGENDPDPERTKLREFCIGTMDVRLSQGG